MLFSFLNKIQKKKYIYCIIVNLTFSLFELLSVLSIPFFLNFLLKKELILLDKFSFLEDLKSNIEFELFALIVFFLIFTLFIFKSFLHIFSTFFVEKYINHLKVDILEEFLKKINSIEYNQFLKHNESEYNRLLTSDIFTFCEAYRDKINFIRDLALAFLFVLSMIIGDVKIIFVCLVVFLISFFIYQFLKKKIITKGEKFLKYKKNVFNLIKNNVQGFIELKVFSIKDFFIKEISSRSSKLWREKMLNLIYSMIPRIYLEIVGLLFLGGILFINVLVYKESTEDFLILLSLIFVCFLRLVPIVNNLVTIKNNLNFNKKTINNVLSYHRYYSDIYKNSEEINFSSLNKDEIFEVKNLNYSIGSKKIFQNLNFKVKKNEIIQIKGGSGSGKSSLAKIIIGLNKQGSTGMMNFNSKYINEYNKKKLFAYVPQDPFVFDGTITENVTFKFKTKENEIDKKYLNFVFECCGLSDFLKEKTKDYIIENRASNISGGQKQRLAIARALYHKSKILILDEATNQLDPDSENKILQNIKSFKLFDCVIFISHNTKNTDFANKMIDIEKFKSF